MQRSKNDVWVGLFVLIGAVAILFLALQSANLLSLSFQKSYPVLARNKMATAPINTNRPTQTSFFERCMQFLSNQLATGQAHCVSLWSVRKMCSNIR